MGVPKIEEDWAKMFVEARDALQKLRITEHTFSHA
jgi:hypothetical protein